MAQRIVAHRRADPVPASPPASNVPERILEAAVRCLVQSGYRGATTPRIIAEAGVSRGAMLHYFPTRDHLMAATARHVVKRWLAAMEQLLGGLTGPGTMIETAVEMILEQLQGDDFIAFMELVAAARTTPEVRKELYQVRETFVARSRRVAGMLFPSLDDQSIAGIQHLFLHYLEGVALHSAMGSDPAAARRDLTFFLEHVMPAMIAARRGT